MVQWVVRLILHGGPIELFLVPVNDLCNKGHSMLSCLWDDAYKRTLAANRKE